MKQELEQSVADVCEKLFGARPSIELTRPDEQFGDYATNAALQLAKQAGKSPREVAETLAAELRSVLAEQVQEIAIAGPGFINFRLSDNALATAASQASTFKSSTYKNQKVVAEYSDPNPFKVLHVGHLYTSLVGDAIANLLEHAGGEVHRVNFGGDVGLHVAKCMWAIVTFLGGEHPEKLEAVAADERASWLSARYVEGASAYEDNEPAKAEIVAINKRVYRLHEAGDHELPFAQLYWTCRQWSYDYFNRFYETVGMHAFDKYYPESATTPLGVQTVRDGLAKGVFVQSDGAVVYPGEQDGLHTRVFLNSAGLPTYEAKDLGLAMAKWQDFHFDQSVMITGNDIVEYMKVVMAALSHFYPEIASRTQHLTHGMIKLAGGVKMSSRKGNFLLATDVLDAAREANKAANGHDDEQASLGAVKYAFLKQRIGGNIIYDPAESVSLQGNSGPYLQYAHARAQSIVRKANGGEATPGAPSATADLEPGERTLARKISEYPEAVERAVAELMPHHICTYLYELAQTFNRFYEHNRVVGDPRAAVRLQLVTSYADVLKAGLNLLGITAPERM